MISLQIFSEKSKCCGRFIQLAEVLDILLDASAGDTRLLCGTCFLAGIFFKEAVVRQNAGTLTAEQFFDALAKRCDEVCHVLDLPHLPRNRLRKAFDGADTDAAKFLTFLHMSPADADAADTNDGKARKPHIPKAARPSFCETEFANWTIDVLRFCRIGGVPAFWRRNAYVSDPQTVDHFLAVVSSFFSKKLINLNSVSDLILKSSLVFSADASENANKSLQNEYLIPVKNGIIAIERDSSGRYDATLKKSSPDIRILGQLETDFDPRANLNQLTQMENLWTSGDNDSVKMLRQMYATCFFPNRFFRRTFILVGPQRCGKSTCAAMVENVVGTPATAHFTVNQISERVLSQIVGKRFVVMDDNDIGKALTSSQQAALKKLISGEKIQVKFLYRDQISVSPSVATLMTANALPEISDTALIPERIVPIVFGHRFTGAGVADLSSPVLRSAVLAAGVRELVSMLNFAVASQDPFVVSGKSAALLDEFAKEQDPYEAYFADIDADGGAEVLTKAGSIQAAYEDFCAWVRCTHFRITKPLTVKMFSKAAIRHFPDLARTTVRVKDPHTGFSVPRKAFIFRNDTSQAAPAAQPQQTSAPGYFRDADETLEAELDI